MNIFRIAIFASGSGSNAEKIIAYFNNHKQIKVNLLLSNNPKAYALQRAKKYRIPTKTFDKNQFKNSNEIITFLKENKIDLIVLAGFLWLIPQNLIQNFPNRIINIHPSLLPKFGGKGMYGDHVHKAVLDAGEKQSGITIHYVNEHFDEGEPIFQAKFDISPQDGIPEIREKCQQLEHEHFAKVIEHILFPEKSCC